jgi:hypothetical protein
MYDQLTLSSYFDLTSYRGNLAEFWASVDVIARAPAGDLLFRQLISDLNAGKYRSTQLRVESNSNKIYQGGFIEQNGTAYAPFINVDPLDFKTTEKYGVVDLNGRWHKQTFGSSTF